MDAKSFLSTTAGAAITGALAAGAEPTVGNVAGSVIFGAIAGRALGEGVRATIKNRRAHMLSGYRAARNEPSFEEQASWSKDLGK